MVVQARVIVLIECKIQLFARNLASFSTIWICRGRDGGKPPITDAHCHEAVVRLSIFGSGGEFIGG
jgi:hypothetical protein